MGGIALLLLFFSMLLEKESFLLLYLSAQFLFGRHVCHIFGRKKLLATVKYRVFCHNFISFGAKQDAYCRILILPLHKSFGDHSIVC